MRIISGFAKSRKLFTPQNDKVIRPTSDRAKEALFSILADRVKDANVIDLFAGTGSFGIEALSRGANSALFVDNGREALKLLEKNIGVLFQSLPDPKKPPLISIIKTDIARFNPLSDRLKVPISDIDIIFMDPPYSKGYVKKVIDRFEQNPSFKPDMLLVAEERSKQDPPQDFIHFHLLEQRRYGDSTFWIYQFKQSPQDSRKS